MQSSLKWSRCHSRSAVRSLCNRISVVSPIRFHIIPILLLLLPLALAYASEADIVKVEVRQQGKSSYNFVVTVSHHDEGWDHYANKWDIISPDGTVLGTRTLHHPHVDEQPFTRRLSRVKIPEEIHHVTVRAHDSVHEYGGKTTMVVLPQ